MVWKARFNLDRWAMVLLVGAAIGLAMWRWVAAHPQHNPWAPLRLQDPVGWATQQKLSHMREAAEECRAFLDRSEVGFTTLPPVGEDQCRRTDRVVATPDTASGLVLRPTGASATCAVNAGLALWLRHGIQPAANEFLGSRVVAMQHLGTASCRRIGGGGSGRWSEHATGNAIDIAAFVLADGQRISVLRDWAGDAPRARFLRAVRSSGCEIFSTTLSPDYNEAHRDHLHLDQAARGGFGFCR